MDYRPCVSGLICNSEAYFCVSGVRNHVVGRFEIYHDQFRGMAGFSRIPGVLREVAMKTSVAGRLLGVGLVMVCAGSARADFSILQSWNLIARNSVTSSSEVDGSALIGGSLLGTSSNYAVQGVTAPANVGLAVGGAVSGGNKQVNNGGNFRFNGAVSATVNLNGGGNAAMDATIPSQITSAFNEVSAIRSYLGSLSANGTIDGAGNMNAAPTLVNGQMVAVYSFNMASIQSLGQLNLNFGSATSVILNVTSNTGVINLVAPPNLIGGFSQANSTRILWNLLDATQISVNNTFNGAMIAPNADLKILGGGVNGSVVVDSISQQSAEIRRFNYTGFIPAPGVAGVLMGFGLMVGRRRR